MADQRTHKSIAERLDLEFNRRGMNPLWRSRRWAMVLAGAIPLAWLAVATAAGRHSIYWSQPVSTAHEFMAHDCQRCHNEPLQPLLRAVTLSETPRSVTDSACRECHVQEADDHHKVLASGFEHTCVTCHREHKGHESLARVSDKQCTNCHAQLPATEHPPGVAKEIASFEQHPEFAALAPAYGYADRFKSDGGEHNASPHLLYFGDGGKYFDGSNIKFNHAKHLAPEGVLMPWQAEKGSPAEKAVHKVLTCADCHEPESDGAYIKPISYERHCAACHVLSFSEKLVPGGPLPHAEPLLVQSTLRERLLAYAKSQAPKDEKQLEPRLPNKSADTPEAAESPAAWVERELADREGQIFLTVANGCAHCHDVEPAPSTGEVGLASRWRIVPTAIPTRWLPLARFRHDKHETVACLSCHAATESKATADILLPSINVCHQCHGNESLLSQGRARADCVECHNYHHSAPAVGKALEELLSR